MQKGKTKPSVFLDVDPSIIERNMTIIKEPSLEDDLNNIFPPTNPVTIIQPLPGFCVKTWVMNESKKVFINICQTDNIPPPDDICDEELIKTLESNEPSSYRVPMSIGESRIENDKSGEKCTVYDVAINTQFFKKIECNEVFRTFFLTIVFEGLQNKYDFELDVQTHVILKNRKSVGTLQTHRVQKRVMEKIITEKSKKPLIEEIETSNEKILKNEKTIPEPVQEKALHEMDFQLIREPREGKLEHLVAEFKINKNLSAEDIILDVGEDRIIVETPTTKELTDIFLPYNIKQETARAALNKNTNILIVTMAAQEV